MLLLRPGGAPTRADRQKSHESTGQRQHDGREEGRQRGRDPDEGGAPEHDERRREHGERDAPSSPVAQLERGVILNLVTETNYSSGHD